LLLDKEFQNRNFVIEYPLQDQDIYPGLMVAKDQVPF